MTPASPEERHVEPIEAMARSIYFAALAYAPFEEWAHDRLWRELPDEDRHVDDDGYQRTFYGKETCRICARAALAALTTPPEDLDLETTDEERSLLALKGRFNYALDENGAVTGAVDWSPLPRLLRDIATLTARLAGVEPWECKGRDSGPGGNPPGDCNWPVCGCDPHASKVIDALEESGAFVTANELAAERTAREAAEDALREARTMAALSPETQTGAALHRAEAALATLREKVRVLGEFAEATTEPNMVGVPAMVLTEALAALLAPSGNGEGTADG